ncbi:MAG: amino acid permease [Deltaproteobacteria bacterium]|nr:MAG: amino acid permease [Deltaproteobacteria bacterium]
MPARTTLERSLSLPLITLYGLGTTIGAGIYALVGEVAGGAGMYAPVAFLVASALAAASALSFAELSSRYPKSAGEAFYVREAFSRPALATTVGLLVVASGSVSAATIANGFVGYLRELVPVPRALALVLLIGSLGALAAWGIRESARVAGLITLIEVGGLALVAWVARDSFAELPDRLPELLPPPDAAIWSGILGASVLAFYAFLGFEDMVNVAEEVRDVRRVLPLAIVITLVLTTVIYGGIAIVAVLSVPPALLAESEAPLALVIERTTGRAATTVSLVSIVAMVNGALVQVIMASRVIYGLADQGSIPARFGRVSPRTRTPLLATGAVTFAVMALALAFGLEPLARVTSLVTLSIFAIVNLSLLRIKYREPPPRGSAIVPAWVPVLGFLASAGIIAFELARTRGP